MALAVSTADDAEQETQLSCSLDDIKTCPSARILKVLLKRMEQSTYSVGSKSENQQQRNTDHSVSVMQSLKSVLEKYDYSATKLLDDLHHLQYDHDLNEDDAKLDAAFDFFKDALSEKGCNVNECPFMVRHYRERGRESGGSLGSDDDVLLDIMSQIHCYLLHSFDTNRLTKEERDRVEIELAIGAGVKSLDDDDNHLNIDNDDTYHEDELSQSNELEKINEILTAKMEKLPFGRDDRRYRDNVDDDESNADQSVDFVTMAPKAGVDEMVLRQGLKEYANDRHRLMSALVDVVYAEDTTKTEIWSKLKMDDNLKAAVFCSILHGHFKSTQLNTDNLIRASTMFIGRKRLQIDIDVLIDVITTNGIDGRMFDKTLSESYENNGTFSKRFKGLSGCKVQHVRQLYTALRKWKYVEVKQQVEMKQDDETVDEKQDEKEDEKELVYGQENEQHDVYEIGKRFYFWDSHRKHPDYVAAKYQNMKEEVLNNPLFAGLIDIRAWNALTVAITALLATERALRIFSNGQSQYMYSIKMYEPLEAQHLRSLKLYTDVTDLSAKFCAILRWAHPKLIEGIAHWARYLTETVQCFGTTLETESAKKTYYRGVARAFIFKMIATRFNLPLSTTSDVKCPGAMIYQLFN